MENLEHPEITNALRTGFPDNRLRPTPICPICNGLCEEIIYSRDGEILGCDLCTSRMDAWEEPECFPERSDC